MGIAKRIEVFGDSILRGIQFNPDSKRYYIDNNIDTEMLSEKFSLIIENHSKFGCTIEKGCSMLEKALGNGLTCDAVIMDFGGNDCDFDWKAISEAPEAEHEPNTPLDRFTETYKNIIVTLREKGIQPILTTLPPLDPQKFFDWFCKGLDKENILKWLGNITAIYRFQENYSRAVEKIAGEMQVPLVDLRGAFLEHRRIDDLLCEDGTHPNTAGQRLITNAFADFAEVYMRARGYLEGNPV